MKYMIDPKITTPINQKNRSSDSSLIEDVSVFVTIIIPAEYISESTIIF